MFSRWFLFLSLVGALMFGPASGLAQTSLPHGSHVAGELLVSARSGVSDADLETTYKGHGGHKVRTLAQIKVHQIKVPDNALDAIEAALKRNPKFAVVEKNYIAQANLVPNDPNFGNQWHLSKVSAPSAWDLTTGSAAVTVAVVDSGVDPYHPDLSNKLVAGYNFLGGSTNDTHDVYGHGTAVAGVIGADTNSGIGVAGLGWNTTIMPLVVVTSSNTASYADIASAINYAADHGAKVINMSLGGTSYSSTLQNAVNYAWSKGLVIVAAAGNNSSSTAFYPAALNNVIAVSATDSNDNLLGFSNFGNWITVGAPGTYIYTTTNGGGYGNWQGTSFASPQVAALAALLFAKNPSLTNQQVLDLIKNNSDDIGAAGFDVNFGWGRINAFRAVQAVQSTPLLSVTITSPSNSSSVSGNVSVTSSVSSQNSVSRVELYIDGAFYATDTTSPFTFGWNTTGLSGSHNLLAKVFDTTGYSATSASVTVSVGQIDTMPPDVQVTGVMYDGKNITITATANDAQSVVTKVEFYIDGKLKATDITAPWSAKINAKPIGGGNHSVQARAYDGAGNVGASGTVTVTTR